MTDTILKYTIPAAFVPRVTAAFGELNGYKETITVKDANTVTTKPNPENIEAFTKRMIKEFIIETVKSYEASKAAREARDNSLETNDFNI